MCTYPIYPSRPHVSDPFTRQCSNIHNFLKTTPLYHTTHLPYCLPHHTPQPTHTIPHPIPLTVQHITIHIFPHTFQKILHTPFHTPLHTHHIPEGHTPSTSSGFLALPSQLHFSTWRSSRHVLQPLILEALKEEEEVVQQPCRIIKQILVC